MSDKNEKSGRLIRVRDPTYVFLVRIRDEMKTHQQNPSIAFDDAIRALAGERYNASQRPIGNNYRTSAPQDFGDIYRLRLTPPPNGNKGRIRVP